MSRPAHTCSKRVCDQLGQSSQTTSSIGYRSHWSGDPVRNLIFNAHRYSHTGSMLATNKYAVQTLGEINQPSGLSALSSLWGGPEQKLSQQEKFLQTFTTICADMIEDLNDLVSLRTRENEESNASQLKRTTILEDDLNRQTSLLRTTHQIIKSDERENSILSEKTVRQI